MNKKQKVLAFISLAIACFLTALDSTIVNVSLSSTAHHSKIRIVDLVNNNPVLILEDQIIDKIRTSDASKNSSFSKDMVDKLIKEKENTVLASTPDEMKPTVEENFNIQTKEIYKFLDKATEIKNDESNKVYNKCFLLTAIITILGLIAVFNKKKETEFDKVKSGLVKA